MVIEIIVNGKIKMKAFKEWRENLLCSNNENFRIVAESTWRTVLEEVLKQIDKSNSDGSIVDWIKEELENE